MEATPAQRRNRPSTFPPVASSSRTPRRGSPRLRSRWRRGENRSRASRWHGFQTCPIARHCSQSFQGACLWGVYQGLPHLADIRRLLPIAYEIRRTNTRRTVRSRVILIRLALRDQPAPASFGTPAVPDDDPCPGIWQRGSDSQPQSVTGRGPLSWHAFTPMISDSSHATTSPTLV